MPSDSSKSALPDFLQVEREVTNDSTYSMYTLSKKRLEETNALKRPRVEKKLTSDDGA